MLWKNTMFKNYSLFFFTVRPFSNNPCFVVSRASSPKKNDDPLIHWSRASHFRWTLPTPLAFLKDAPPGTFFVGRAAVGPDFFDQKATENERSLGKCPCFRRKIICGSNFSGPNTGYGLGQLDPRFHGVRLHQPKCWVYWDLINRKI